MEKLKAYQAERNPCWDRPNLILHTGRCGSSYLAGEFIKHGYSGGIVDQYNENRTILNLIYRIFGRDWKGEPPRWKPWRRQLEIILNRQFETPYMLKIGAFYYQIFKEFDPIVIKLKRPIPETFTSFRRKGFLKDFNDVELMRLIEKQHKILDAIPGMEIWTNELDQKTKLLFPGL